MKTKIIVAAAAAEIVAALSTVLPHMLFGNASLPIATLLQMLLLVLAAGFLSSWLAARYVGRLPLLESLRHDG